MARSPFDLHGQVAVVTGGNSGICLAMADALAAAGPTSASGAAIPERNKAAETKLVRHLWTESPMTHDALSSPAAIAKMLPRVPVRRWGEPEDFAGMAVYLASPASKYHTGDTIVIDGGYSVF